MDLISRNPMQNFNPRAREGRDRQAQALFVPSANFNPRAREGRDDAAVNQRYQRSPISIHAPVKGATSQG